MASYQLSKDGYEDRRSGCVGDDLRYHGSHKSDDEDKYGWRQGPHASHLLAQPIRQTGRFGRFGNRKSRPNQEDHPPGDLLVKDPPIEKGHARFRRFI